MVSGPIATELQASEASEPISDLGQSASADFFVPMALAYLAACLTWWAAKRLAGSKWPDEDTPNSDRPRLDLLLVVVVAISVLAIGQAFRADLLIPRLPGNWHYLSRLINLCLPYVPIFICLVIRRQTLQTLWLSSRSLTWKISTGTISALIAVTIYTLFRGDLSSLSVVGKNSLTAQSLSLAVPVFLEGVALAFLFVRLKWAIGPAAAVIVPSLLFALAHIPGGIESGSSAAELSLFFCFNTSLVAVILLILMRSRDVIWIALPHYVLDVASNAFVA